MAAISIPEDEFRRRQEVFANELSQGGLSGAVVWSLGGASADHHVDVAYLANHHAMIPHIPANPALTAPGFSALVVSADGSGSTLLTTTLDDPDDRSVADDVRQVAHLPQAVADVLRERDIERERVGLAGRETLLAMHHDLLVEHAPHVSFEACDAILDRHRAIKSERELDLLRHAAEQGCRWMEATMEAVRPGVTEADIVAEGLDRFIRDGGIQYDVAIAAGANSKHYWGSAGLPHWDNRRPLETGDMLHVDLWGPVNDYYTDFARSTVVGGNPTAKQLEVLEANIDLIETLTDMVRPGVVVGDIHREGMSFLEDKGFLDSAAGNQSGANFTDMFPAFGHFLGLSVESPQVIAGDPTELEENMVIALEAFVARPEVGGSNFEHNIIVTADGGEVLTRPSPSRFWEVG